MTSGQQSISRGRRTRGERVTMVMMPICPPLSVLWVLGATIMSGPVRGGSVPKTALPFIFLPLAVMITVVAAGAVWHTRARRRSREELMRAKGHLCLNCRYPLDAKLEAGVCPECGAPFDLFSLKRGWCRTYTDLAYEIDWPARRDQGGAS